MRRIAQVLTFFQGKNKFTPGNWPGVPPCRRRRSSDFSLSMDLLTLTFEEVNHLWGFLGAKEMPFALYRGRLVALADQPVPSRAAGSSRRSMCSGRVPPHDPLPPVVRSGGRARLLPESRREVSSKRNRMPTARPTDCFRTRPDGDSRDRSRQGNRRDAGGSQDDFPDHGVGFMVAVQLDASAPDTRPVVPPGKIFILSFAMRLEDVRFANYTDWVRSPPFFRFGNDSLNRAAEVNFLSGRVAAFVRGRYVAGEVRARPQVRRSTCFSHLGHRTRGGAGRRRLAADSGRHL